MTPACSPHEPGSTGHDVVKIATGRDQREQPGTHGGQRVGAYLAFDLSFKLAAGGQRGVAHLLPLSGQAEMPATSVPGNLDALHEARALGLVGKRAGRLLRHVEHFRQARDAGLLGGDGADHKAERRPHAVNPGVLHRRPQSLGERPVGGGEEDRQVG
jgi:hypothetical protein